MRSIFRKGGWSAKYPTRSLEQWEEKLAAWKKYLFEKGPHPGRGGRKKKTKTKKPGKQPGKEK